MKCFARASWFSSRGLQLQVQRHILSVITADINPLNFQVSKLALDKMKGWMIRMSWENCTHSDSCFIYCHFHFTKSNVGLNWLEKVVVFFTVCALSVNYSLKMKNYRELQVKILHVYIKMCWTVYHWDLSSAVWSIIRKLKRFW